MPLIGTTIKGECQVLVRDSAGNETHVGTAGEAGDQYVVTQGTLQTVHRDSGQMQISIGLNLGQPQKEKQPE